MKRFCEGFPNFYKNPIGASSRLDTKQVSFFQKSRQVFSKKHSKADSALYLFIKPINRVHFLLAVFSEELRNRKFKLFQN